MSMYGMVHLQHVSKHHEPEVVDDDVAVEEEDDEGRAEGGEVVEVEHVDDAGAAPEEGGEGEHWDELGGGVPHSTIA